MLKTGMNISQKQSQKLIMLPSYGITAYKQKKKANKPDIALKDKREKTCKLINVNIPADKNVSVPEFEELSKHKDLEIEIEKLWHMKIVIIPVVIGALGMI